MDNQYGPMPEFPAPCETFIGPPMLQPMIESQIPAVRKKAGITTIDLSSRTCRWPFGDPAATDFHYCGQLPQINLPYCPTHASLSRQSYRKPRPMELPKISA